VCIVFALTAERVEGWLIIASCSPSASKDNEKRAVSSFASLSCFCLQRMGETDSCIIMYSSAFVSYFETVFVRQSASRFGINRFRKRCSCVLGCDFVLSSSSTDGGAMTVSSSLALLLILYLGRWIRDRHSFSLLVLPSPRRQNDVSMYLAVLPRVQVLFPRPIYSSVDLLFRSDHKRDETIDIIVEKSFLFTSPSSDDETIQVSLFAVRPDSASTEGYQRQLLGRRFLFHALFPAQQAPLL
jgi:hypothetical protein